MVYDFCIIGGGIVGLATAHALLERRPGAGILIFDKERQLATHQSGHNSGVIHAGIYYAPGSLKASLCRAGLHATIAFCQTHNIRYEQCGKLVVATNSTEEKRIDDLYGRAVANGLKLRRLNGDQLRELEPAVSGTAALLSPETAIVDYREVCSRLAESLAARGVEIVLDTEIQSISEVPSCVSVSTGGAVWSAKQLVVCGGLQADRLARLAGLEVSFRIVPFRGEYFKLPPTLNEVVSHLIYPAPDPSLPFLGVHLTRMIDGSITVGPNAVLGFARERYPKFSFNLSDTASFLSFGGFWKLMWNHRGHAAHEFKGSLFRAAYLQECRKYCPQLKLSDLLPYRAGIRAQVVQADGTAVHDFLFKQTDRMLHVCNAPSPAATSAIPIGRMIAEKIT
ncbi:MAG TPA: L-2-hydroxyglutarate oxidase [Sphingomicrobium sp.]|nr:L-2-hydroxyglutarate oxidase [Sphingomicrobium sp.]